MWIVISQISCLAAAVALLAIVYDLDKETPAPIRWLLVGMSTAFFGTFLVTWNNRAIYEHASSIAFTGMAVLVLACIAYLILRKQIQPVVMKVTGAALGLSFLLWVVGSCSDIKRQEIQIQDAKSASDSIRIADSTQTAITNFNSLTR